MPRGNPTTTFTTRIDAETRKAIEAAARATGQKPCSVASQALAAVFRGLGHDLTLAVALRDRTQELGLARPEVPA